MKIQRNKYNQQMKKKWLNQIDNALKPLFANALNNGFFSGAAVGVYLNEKWGEKRYIKTYGKTRNDIAGEKINKHTLFDLASLTKPLCTVLSILCLIEQKKIKRDSPFNNLIRFKIGSEFKKITIEDVLSHSSGLIDYKPYYKDYKAEYNKEDKKKLIHTLLREPLAYKTGSKCLYSDLGYILLGEVIENISGRSLDDFYLTEIIEYFEIKDELCFRPVRQFDPYSTNIAATEHCSWRNKIMQGEVHDEHCWLVGGVAGHAGLFGSIGGVLSITECILKQWTGKVEYPVYSNELLQSFLTKQFFNQTWCLGFDTPSESGSSAGKYLSGKSVGHLGFTGTSFWIDPVRELVVVLLTNRIHPTRKNENIQKFRPLFHDTVIESLN